MQNLIIVISKIDCVDFDADRVGKAIQIVSGQLEQFGLGSRIIPIIPISIQIHINDGDYVREEHNVSTISGSYTPEPAATLLSVIAQKGKNFYVNQHTELFASISGLYKIKDKRGHAFRIKVLQEAVRMDSRVTIGPLKHIKDNSLCYITGKIKSLKEESAQEIVSSLDTGVIGGISFSSVYDAEYDSPPPSSKLHQLEEYKILKTSVLTGGCCLSGNSITLSVLDDELSSSSLLALDQLLPKESINFFWFGRRIISEIIEIYHNKNKWYITLCPLVAEYKNSIGDFTVPVDQKGAIPKFECLVVLQLLQKSNNKVTSRYHNYINFTLEAIHNYFTGGQYVVHFTTDSNDFAFIADDFKISLADVTPHYVINNEQRELIVYQVTSRNVGNVMKSIRGVVRDSGLIGYSLKVNPMED